MAKELREKAAARLRQLTKPAPGKRPASFTPYRPKPDNAPGVPTGKRK